MIEQQESAITDPRASLNNYSNRQDSSFQYGDPPKSENNNVSKLKAESTDKIELTQLLDDDSYDVEEADKKYLEAKPTCFLLVGKPGVGKTALARKLADDWHAELINLPDLITSNMKQKTEIGMHARELLVHGEAVPDQMIARMLDIKMRSPEVAHHGYILDGFPLIDENLMKLRDQMDTMKNWPLPPDYVINIRIPDNDLVNRRKEAKIDPMTGIMYIKEQYAPEPVQKTTGKQQSGDDDDVSDIDEDPDNDEEEAEEDDQVTDEFFAPVPTEIVERLVTRPEDMIPDVGESIQFFKDQLLRMLEEYMASLPQSYLVELDGNMSPTILFEQLLERLNAYPIRRAALVQRFFPPETDEEEISHESGEMENEEEEGEKAIRNDPVAAEEAAPADEMETEELMNSLTSSNVLSNKYKWQRSRWLRLDPVALKQGNRVPGRQDLAVHFMDKIFVLSSKESLKEFQKNPRRYIMQPRAPCKLFLYGPRASGVEQLAQEIAKKYNATVIDMVTYAKPKMDELRQQYVENIKSEIERTTIEKVQQQLDADAAERLNRESSSSKAEGRVDEEQDALDRDDNEATIDPNSLETAEKIQTPDDEELQEQPPAATERSSPPPAESSSSPPPPPTESAPSPPPTELTASPRPAESTSSPAGRSPPTGRSPVPPTEVPKEDLHGLGPEDVPTQVEPVGKVTADHPEVRKAVEQAIEEAGNAAVNIPADVYAELMHKAIQNIEQEQREKNPNGPLFGNWIFVNFPYDNEVWTILNEKNIHPDDVIVVQDSHAQLEALQKRWYQANRTEIDREIREREDREAYERRIKDEEQKRRMEEMKIIAEQERNERLAERQKKIEAGEPVDDEDDAAEKEMEQAILDDRNYEPKKEDFIDKIPETIPEEDETMSKEPDKDKSSSMYHNERFLSKQNDRMYIVASGIDLTRPPPSISPILFEQDILPPAGIEQDTFVQQARTDITRISDLMKIVSSVYNVEPIIIELMKEDGEKLKTNEDIFQEAYDALEKQYKYTVIENESNEEEVDEEEEEAGAEEESGDDDNEEEEEIVDLFRRDRKKHLGDLNIYDPVALYDKNMLIPGKPDFTLSYKSKTYRFANEDNRSLFLQTPLKYLPTNKPPTLPSTRIVFVGPEGVGKSLHGRELATKYNTFHIKFRDRLQELLIGKTKVRIGPEYNEARDDGDPEEEEDQKAEKPADESEDLTSEEENIKAYLQDGEPLAPEILDKIVKPWWTEEPYRSRGIVLEGFPSSEDETVYMIDNQLIPDVVIQLDAEGKDILKRILPRRMEQWRTKMQLRKEKRLKNKAKKDRDKKKAMDERRVELILEREKRIEAGETVEDDEIEQTLASEFQGDEEEGDAAQDEEDAETAKGRIGEMIEQQANDAKDKIEGVKKVIQQEYIPFVHVNASDKPRFVRNRIMKKIERFTTLRKNLFERVYPIKAQLAQKLIDAGYLHYSKFGKFCPVSLHNGDCFPPPFGPDKSPCTVIYRKYIYYLADEEARNEFIKNPMFYARQSPPKSLIPAKIAIVGPPKSGKTTAANRIVQEMGCVRISLGGAIRYILEKQRHTILGKEMQEVLIKGKDILPETAVRCLEVALMNAKCQTRGYILDGFPLTKQHVELLVEKGIIPFKLFELECDVTECTIRAMKDRSDLNRPYPLPDSPEAISYKNAIYQSEIMPVRQWYTEEHKNWMTLNAKSNKWLIWDRILNETAAVTKKIQNYIERKSFNKAASIADLCISPQELLNRLGEYEHYCPVSLTLRDQLVDCSADTKADNIAEYRGRYYRMAGPKELELFLDEPERYAPLEPRKLLPPPNRRPHRRTEAEAKAMFPKPIEFAGYCSVTYLDGGKKYECLVLGQQEFAVEYRDKLYFLLSEEARERFMRQPEKYWNIRLPHKLPPPKNPIDLLNLPCLGYLEQTVATAIIKSLTATGCFKPKFPFLSVQASALTYMAYHLKAYNTKSSDYLRRKFRRKLYIFEEQCELISYLAQKTAVRYKEPEKRSADYNVKYETFFALRHNVPTLNWLT
ncbi:unnamed protein product [Rotaria magnacalcarata]|uniref:Nucleoside-diphosphate kinase n=1 Tax=Rotaria magnacalcarata TaxID=392030 RepID=A0A816NAK6_9BILA|nr:unnamed protein product [Rotaria magnacalcarata]CAF2033302.1 unnamed protein product [Rotaria magnacalcarata]